ncbi:MAG: flagellar basal body-associated FliL family protein [Nitrospirae bacterium]|nr:flagellar basal body-associated FliL family protein [Nitrospirota bacterium]
MANEFEEGEQGEGEQPEGGKPSKGKIKLIIIIAVAVIVLSAGGFLAFKMFLGGGHKDDKESSAKHEEKTQSDVKLLGAPLTMKMEPFIANLTDKHRYVKISIDVEIVDKAYEATVTEKMPNLRDAIIILLSSKSSDTLGTIEGKLQLKDELLVRLNQVMDREIFKNIYFTDFVMQ